MELCWPADIIPGAVSWRIIDNAAVFNSPLAPADRVYGRPGTRLGCTMQFINPTRATRHRIMGFLAAVNGRYSSVWLSDFGTAIRGTFPAVELLSNTTFDVTTGWTSSNAELVLSGEGGRMRQSRTAVAANRQVSSPNTTTSGLAYVWRANLLKGRGAMTYQLRIGTTATGAEIAGSSTFTAAGYQQISGVSSGTTTYAAIQDNISGRAADDFMLLEGASFARCALVSGAGQTGSSLWIDALPASTNGLLLAGDIVAVYTTRWEMKRLVFNLNANSSGQGQLIFEPALRTTPSDNAPIAIYMPTGKFMLATDTTGWDTTPGLFSDFSLEWVEDFR
jgi:hypothetical protein